MYRDDDQLRWEERLIAAAKRKFPGSRELVIRAGYCEACRTAFGHYSDALGAVLCNRCWRPRFYGGSPDVAERARELRGAWHW
jgi:hypothetical protein